MAEQERVLLPKELKPTHYELTLTPNLIDFTFAGHVVVSLEILQTANKIDLHSIELEFQQIKVTQEVNKKIKFKSILKVTKLILLGKYI